MSDPLLLNLPDVAPPSESTETELPQPEPRYEVPNRTQTELYPCDLETLLPPGHAARLVWRFVEGLDLKAFYDAIRAREGHPGRTPIDPRILIASGVRAKSTACASSMMRTGGSAAACR